MSATAFPPQASIIGAQKAGTTTLAALLGQHRDIVLAEPKETIFYAINGGNGDDRQPVIPIECHRPGPGGDAATAVAEAETRVVKGVVPAGWHDRLRGLNRLSFDRWSA